MTILADHRAKKFLKWGLAGIGFIALSSAALPTYLVWNASTSLPRGLYLILTDDNIRPGQIAVMKPTPALQDWMARRGYLPRDIPLLKQVAATRGTRVCRTGDIISVRAKPVAVAKHSDRWGRKLPVWQGCFVVGKDELFLLNARSADSLDGRYFGALPAKNMIGRAVAIWTPDDE